MAGEDEEIDIRAQFHDEVSRPANTAAASVDNLGDEARETAAELAMMGRAADESGDELDDLGESATRAEKRLASQQRAIKRNRDELGRFTKATDESGESAKTADGWWRKFFRTLGIGDSVMNRTGRRAKWLGRIIRFGLGTVKWALIATGVSFLATAIEGLGAAAIAGAAGLAPLTGMLVAYPSMLSALAQGITTFKLATSGMGDLIGVLSDPEASAEDIEKAMAGMHQNQVLFARAVADSKKEWKGLKKEIGGRFFRDLDEVYGDLSKNYLPIADRYLGRTADSWNRIIKYNAAWLNSRSGQQTIRDIMQDNVFIIEDMGLGMSNVLRIMANLTRAGGPMMREMSFDFREWTAELARDTYQNQDRLESFFNRSYDLFKATGNTLENYMVGLYNIGKQSDALSKYLGTSIDEIGKKFRQWTETAEGRRDIRAYFRDIIPVVRELGLWVRDLSKFASDITMDNDDFVKSSKALRTVGLPAVASVVRGLTKAVVPALDWVNQVYGDLKESGAVGGVGRVLRVFASGIEWTANKLAGLPDGVKNVIAFATTVGTAYALLKRVGPIKGLLGAATGGRFGVQKVFVVNMPPGGFGRGRGSGGTTVVPGGGPGDGAKTKTGRLGSIGRKIGRAIPFVGTGMAVGEFAAANPMDRSTQGGGGALGLGGGNIKERIDAWRAEQNAIVKTGQAVDTVSDKMRGFSSNSKLLEDSLKRQSALAPEAAHNNKLFGDSYKGLSQNAGTAENSFAKLTNRIQGVPKESRTNVTTPGGQEGYSLFGNLKGAIERVPESKSTRYSLSGASEALGQLDSLGAKLDWVARPRESRITITRNYSNAGLETYGGLRERWAGGETVAGRKYLTGEIGPEAFVPRGGGPIKLLGLNGPEVASPGTGAVIPHTATQDPYGGSKGLAPEWAIQTLRKAVDEASEGAMRKPTQQVKTRESTQLPPVSVGPVYANSGIDIEQAVRNGIAQAMRDAEERR